MSDERKSKLLITFGLFLLLFNYPFLTIVEKWADSALFVYFFAVWALMIVVIIWIMRRKFKGK